jgi:hypothetical protein
VRTFWNAGIAMAANRPMMTTTIMISTRVKPFLDDVCILREDLRRLCIRDDINAAWEQQYGPKNDGGGNRHKAILQSTH